MVLFRWVILLSLVSAIFLFVLYAATGQLRFKTWGLIVLKWTLIAAFGFFAILIADRVAWARLRTS